MTTLKDIAKLANVSISTVSRVLNKDSDFKVKKETRELIHKIAKDYNYKTTFKNTTIQPINIALITDVPDNHQIENPYYIEISQQIKKQCEEKNYNLKYYHLSMIDIDKIKNKFNYLLIMGHSDKMFSKNFFKLKEKIICIGSSPTPIYFDSIRPNLEYAMREIFKDIKIQKISSVGFIGAYSSDYKNKKDLDLNERYSLFKYFAEERGIFDERNVVNGFYNMKDGYELMNVLIHRDNLCQAYIVANDQMAIGAMKALKEHNLKIPEDVKIYSFDNSSLSKYSETSLTSVDLNIEDMAKSIFYIIDSRNSGRDFPIQISVASQLIIRESSIG